MEQYSDFINLLYFYFQQYTSISYNDLTYSERKEWPGWIGIDIKFEMFVTKQRPIADIEIGHIYADTNNILHSPDIVYVCTNDRKSIYSLLEALLYKLSVLHIDYKKYSVFQCKEDKVSTIPEINEFSDCKISYNMFYENIGRYYEQCCILQKNIYDINHNPLYNIFFEFNEKYKSLLMIKEYLKRDYQKNYPLIKLCKGSIKILLYEKEIFRNMYNSMIFQRYTNNFNYIYKIAPVLQKNDMKYYEEIIRWHKTIFPQIKFNL